MVAVNSWLWETSQKSSQVVRKLMYTVRKYHIVLKDEIEMNLLMVYK
jgi:hypothetical protein